MAYTKKVWTEGVDVCDKTNMDHLETQYDEAVAVLGKISNGTYTGNSAQNRAIAHGLARTPKLVLIYSEYSSTLFYKFICMASNPTLYFYSTKDADGYSGAVTTMDATNFYVGAVLDKTTSANFTGLTYYWVAMG